MRLGYNTNGFAHHRLEDALEILADLGYESVAITLDYHALNPIEPALESRIAAVRRILDSRHLNSVIETGARYLLDPWRKQQPTLLSAGLERERRLDFLRRAIDFAAALGSDAVSFWSGTPTDTASDEEHMSRLVEGCRMLCRYADERDVRLAFEPEPGMFIDTMARYADLVSRVNHDRFGLTIDIGHLHCLGEVPISGYLRQWRDRLWNVHIEDMKQGVHDHLAFGDGEIDFVPVMRTLDEIGYSGGVHVELSRHSHDAVNVARNSLAFLRNIKTAIAIS